MELVAQLEVDDAVWCCAFAPSRSDVLAVSQGKSVKIWQLSQPKPTLIATLSGAHSRAVRSMSWSPCGRYLLSASFDSTVGVWEAPGFAEDDETGMVTDEWECIATLEGHENEVKRAVFNASTTLVATCGRDKSVWIWDADVDGEREFECVSVLHGHAADVKYVAFHPSEDAVFSASYDCTVKMWIEDMDDWRCAHTMKHTDTVWSLSFFNNNAKRLQLATACEDGTLRVWQEKENGEEWEKVAEVHSHSGRAAYAVASSSSVLLSGGGDDAIRGWRVDLEEGFEEAFCVARARTQRMSTPSLSRRMAPSLRQGMMVLLGFGRYDSLVTI